MATKFDQIKSIVTKEKENKMRGEARLASLKEEKERIFAQINAEIGQEITSVEDGERVCKELQDKITEEISKMEEVLRSEGIELD